MRRQKRSKTRRHRISDAAVAAWIAGDEVALDDALDLPPWHMSPLHCDEPPANDLTAYAESWERACELRLELIEAAKDFEYVH